MKDPIRDFVYAWAQYDKENVYTETIDWHSRLSDAGYYSAKFNQSLSFWKIVHEWCKEQFGERHYTWTGSVFWFDRREDAMLFMLRWS